MLTVVILSVILFVILKLLKLSVKLIIKIGIPIVLILVVYYLISTKTQFGIENLSYFDITSLLNNLKLSLTK